MFNGKTFLLEVYLSLEDDGGVVLDDSSVILSESLFILLKRV